jgi:signal transduction histidine kinase
MIAFASVIGVLLSAQVLRYFAVQAVDRDVDDLYGNALQSVRLVGLIGRGIHRWRILIDRHIVEKNFHSMDALDKEITSEMESYRGAAREYEPLVAYPGEGAMWGRLKQDLANAETGVGPVLADSRKNLDTRARKEMDQLEPTLERIESEIDGLTEINRRAAAMTAARVRREQHESLLSSAGLSLAAAALSLLIATWVIPLVGGRQREIEDNAAQLESRNRELDAFAGRVAHDLRGPLSAVSIAAARISEHLPEEGANAVLRRGIRRIENLIDDLLLLSRVDAQLPGEASTAEAAQSLEADLRPLIADGKLVIEAEPARVRCSQGLLLQVLWNLGTNSVKYRRPQVPLSLAITGRVVGGRYEFRVTDNGSGMPPGAARHAFEPFFRGTQHEKIPGTGLGLSIVKRVIEASGGDVTLDSTEGVGTTIRFALSLA